MYRQVGVGQPVTSSGKGLLGPILADWVEIHRSFIEYEGHFTPNSFTIPYTGLLGNLNSE